MDRKLEKMMRLLAILVCLLFLKAGSAQAFETIRLSNDSRTAVVLIDDFGTNEIADKFVKDIEHLPLTVRVLRFNEDNFGGRTPHAWKIAKTLRERGITTFIDDAYCASMCTLIFMGGIKRDATPGSSFMIHVVRGNDRNPAATTKVNAYVGGLYKRYGLSEPLAEKIFITDESTRTDHRYSAVEAQQIGLVTDIRRTLKRYDDGSGSTTESQETVIPLIKGLDY
ncbi:hypothetical protein [Terasakiella brassicae]|nr:hypothetical protein [Terasakiella brassicae]